MADERRDEDLSAVPEEVSEEAPEVPTRGRRRRWSEARREPEPAPEEPAPEPEEDAGTVWTAPRAGGSYVLTPDGRRVRK